MVIYRLICKCRETVRNRGPERGLKEHLFGGNDESCYKINRRAV